jgi:hypothetical protein
MQHTPERPAVRSKTAKGVQVITQEQVAQTIRNLGEAPEELAIANPLTPQELARITVSIELVTPQMAAEWLGHNPTNRQMSPNRLRRNTETMREGDWGFNGQPITKDKNGNVVDGQHRLASLISAQMSAWFIVIRGLEPIAQETTDLNQPRKLKDMIYRRGYANHSDLAAVTNWLWRYLEGKMTGTAYASKFPTVPQGLKVFEEHVDGFQDSLRVGSRVGKSLKVGRPVFSMLHYVLSDIDQEDTDEFFARLADGQALVEGDSIYALRRAIDNLRKQQVSHTRGIPGEYLAAITIKAWNSYRRGDRNVKVVVWKRGGAHPEPFPTPIVAPL